MMKGMFFSICTIFFAITLGQMAFAADVEKPEFSPIEGTYATWVFSGIVSSESGENYGYFFQIQRDNQHFHAIAALIDESNKQVVMREESDAVIDNSMPYDWQIGNAFLKFNTINHSWIFGVKPHNKLGFSFKVDMLKQFESAPNFHHLRSGMTMMVSQTGELNGHVLTGSLHAEQFVTANDTWFRQIWQDEADINTQALTGVLCQFVDGSGFYSVNLNDPAAQSGAISAWYNPQSVRQIMSQFIQVSNTKNGEWHIQSRAPLLDLVLASPMIQNFIVAGFTLGNKHPGFCLLNLKSG